MSNYEFDVLIHGNSATKYRHEGRYYLEGRPGSEFTLLVRNNTALKVLAVMTVDGLSIMDGKKAGFDGRGYIVDPYQTLKVPGWRLDDDDVAKFVFSKKGKAYASKQGEGGNVGVVGCAIFEEDRSTITWTGVGGPLRVCGCTTVDATDGNWYITTTTEDIPCSYNVDTSDACTVICDSVEVGTSENRTAFYSSVVRDRGSRRTSTKKLSVQNLGTGFGKKASHEVTEVSFNRKDRPTKVFAIHYDDRNGLEARGINLSRKVKVANPFPKEGGRGCVPPADWNG